MSSGFILVAVSGPFSQCGNTEEPVPRIVPLRRVKKVLDGESSHDWNERSGRHDDDAEREGFGDHEAECQPVHDAQAFGDHEFDPAHAGYAESFGDYDGVMAGCADDDDSHEELLRRIGALSAGGKR